MRHFHLNATAIAAAILTLAIGIIAPPGGPPSADAQGVTVRTRDLLGGAADRISIETGVNVAEIDILNAYMNFNGISAPPISAVGEGRIYFDSTTNSFQVSENNGLYVPLTGAGSN